MSKETDNSSLKNRIKSMKLRSGKHVVFLGKEIQRRKYRKRIQLTDKTTLNHTKKTVSTNPKLKHAHFRKLYFGKEIQNNRHRRKIHNDIQTKTKPFLNSTMINVPIPVVI